MGSGYIPLFPDNPCGRTMKKSCVNNFIISIELLLFIKFLMFFWRFWSDFDICTFYVLNSIFQWSLSKLMHCSMSFNRTFIELLFLPVLFLPHPKTMASDNVLSLHIIEMVPFSFGNANCIWMVDPVSDVMPDVSWFKWLACVSGGSVDVNVTSNGWFNGSLLPPFFFYQVFPKLLGLAELLVH